jgi:hypothetical protein
MMRPNIMMESVWRSRAAHFMAARKHKRNRKEPGTRYVLQKHILNDLLPPTRSHLSIMPSNYQLISGLIHCSGQSSHDPNTSQCLNPPAGDHAFSTCAFGIHFTSKSHPCSLKKKKKKVSVLVSGKKEGEGAATSICHSVE